MIERVTGVVTLPLRIAGQLAGGLVDRVVDGSGQDRWEVRPEIRQELDPDPGMNGTPKSPDDVAITRKVERVILEVEGTQNGNIDVYTASGVVWLRGEAKAPDLIDELERRVGEVPEVRRVENLLHLSEAPAPRGTSRPFPEARGRI
jgi:osmotically-inducible protein OsmY